jgi:hypothetical protein
MLVKLPLAARRRGMSTNDFARSVVNGLVGLSGPHIREIPEPSLEPTNPRLSLYLGQDAIKVLDVAATSSSLSHSAVLRRALNAALTRDLIRPVQPAARRTEESLSWFPIVLIAAATIVVPILSALAGTRIASEQKKGTL